MITRELKLKPNKKQTAKLEEWLWILTGVFNFAVRKIELNANNKKYFKKNDFGNLLAGHSEKLGVPSHTIQAVLMTAFNAWKKCFRKQARKPHLKSVRRKLRSIPFPDLFNRKYITNNHIKLQIFGEIKYFKQDVPDGQIKNLRLVRKASGWYCQLTIDTDHIFPVKDTTKTVGIDTGFKTLATLSDGTKFDNQRMFVQSQTRLAKAQRGKNRKLTARLNERIKNRRRDYNHKVSRQIVENYQEIYITNDNLRGQAVVFGKSVSDAGISQLRLYLLYKGDKHGRVVKLVDSRNSTRTCSNCGCRSGPTGLDELDARFWVCIRCGTKHDRDINAAVITLKVGSGYDLVNPKLLC
jgi:transposase